MLQSDLEYYPIRLKKYNKIKNEEETISSIDLIKDIKLNINSLINIIFVGEPGIGKTRLLKEISRIESQNFEILYLHFIDLTSNLKIETNKVSLILVDGLDEIDENLIIEKMRIINKMNSDKIHF